MKCSTSKLQWVLGICTTEQVATVSADTAALVEHCAYHVRAIPEPATIDKALESTHAKE